MVNANELRLGNYILCKTGVRILPTPVGFQHFELLAKGLAKEMFAMPLKPELLIKIGFIENKEYYQLPDGKEFILALPVIGNNANQIRAYVNSKEVCYARAILNEMVISNNIHQLHQLQNLYYALTGTEMDNKF